MHNVLATSPEHCRNTIKHWRNVLVSLQGCHLGYDQQCFISVKRFQFKLNGLPLSYARKGNVRQSRYLEISLPMYRVQRAQDSRTTVKVYLPFELSSKDLTNRFRGLVGIVKYCTDKWYVIPLK
uniref:Uncharacterized protein n=1 Tax=Anguilla anguilla TaxID=7936 RepID=A0A0E9X132_ANGAN